MLLVYYLVYEPNIDELKVQNKLKKHKVYVLNMQKIPEAHGCFEARPDTSNPGGNEPAHECKHQIHFAS